MGSPVRPIVANLYMEEIEDHAIQTAQTPPKTWKRYVDDISTLLKKSFVTAFHDILNPINPPILFPLEHERDRQLPFVDTLVSHSNGTITTNVYQKPTHTNRYLDYNSHHDKKHKISTATTLLRRASKIPNTEDGKAEQIQQVTETLRTNG